MGKRIGVLGGSFDPLHYGHLILAEQIRQEADLDLVLLVPAYVNPFKEEVPPAEGKHRLAMLKLAVSDHYSSRSAISNCSAKARRIRTIRWPN